MIEDWWSARYFYFNNLNNSQNYLWIFSKHLPFEKWGDMWQVSKLVNITVRTQHKIHNPICCPGMTYMPLLHAHLPIADITGWLQLALSWSQIQATNINQLELAYQAKLPDTPAMRKVSYVSLGQKHSTFDNIWRTAMRYRFHYH